jgi:hypothetical protein
MRFLRKATILMQTKNFRRGFFCLLAVALLAVPVAELKAENWADRVTLSGAVEVEVGIYDDDTVTESDISVATVELGVDSEISDFSSANVLLLYEDGEDLLIDEASITIGNSQEKPVLLDRR